jgi:hypothetical protein|tara:strand:+ start:1087 stop:1623 length:537 start_codon:yes stop_codon:yes gene_type:complete
MSEFNKDNNWQRSQRDAILVPHFYKKHATDGRYVLLDKGRFADIIQKRLAADTIVQSRDGAVVAIEEKIVRWPVWDKPHFAFCLETDSCTVPGRESDGWMHYAKADYLLYCFQQRDKASLLCYLLDFQRLKDWFWPREEEFKVFQMDQINKTMGRLAPINEAMEAAGATKPILLPHAQ